MRGKKGEWQGDPDDLPPRRANKRCGRGLYANDRPPICSVVDRQSRQVRIRVVTNTQGVILCPFVEKFTKADATLYTDEYNRYNRLKRCRYRFTICHSQNEWSRDNDEDSIREVHANSNEGGWTGLRNFLRPFRGVHKIYLSGYVAIHEFAVNQKCVSPEIIVAIVRLP